MSPEIADDFAAGWYVLELMGHRRVCGYIQVVTVAGASFLRVDVPEVRDDARGVVLEARTQFYSPGALYGFHPLTEAMAQRLIASVRPPDPVQRWEIATTSAEPRPNPWPPDADSRVVDLDDEVDYQPEPL